MRNRHLYSPEWFSIIRPRELARAKFKCENCGIKQRSYGYYDSVGVFIECDEFIAKWAKEHGFKVKRVWLQIAHVNQLPSDNSPENLRVMCPKCHLKHDHEFNRIKKIAAVKSQ